VHFYRQHLSIKLHFDWPPSCRHSEFIIIFLRNDNKMLFNLPKSKMSIKLSIFLCFPFHFPFSILQNLLFLFIAYTAPSRTSFSITSSVTFSFSFPFFYFHSFTYSIRNAFMWMFWAFEVSWRRLKWLKILPCKACVYEQDDFIAFDIIFTSWKIGKCIEGKTHKKNFHLAFRTNEWRKKE